MKLRTFLVIFFLLVLAWFLYLVRALLTPFILAAVFAYIISPLVAFLEKRTRINRTVFVIFLYVILLSLLIWLGMVLSRQFFHEAQTLTVEANNFLTIADSQVYTLPDWLQGFATDTIVSVRENIALDHIAILPFFSGAASRVVTFVTFLFASFYFLKDGHAFIEHMLLRLPSKRKIEAEIVLNKINRVLGNYLRGQLMIVFIMAFLGTIILTFFGVRFSLLLGIMIGLAEIIPMFGPIIIALVIGLVAIFDGVSRFNLPPLYDGLFVVTTYALINQLENYLIVPNIMGKFTKLHPLIVFFAVLTGGHLFGVVGFMLAVPVAAILRIILEYILDKFAAS